MDVVALFRHGTGRVENATKPAYAYDICPTPVEQIVREARQDGTVQDKSAKLLLMLELRWTENLQRPFSNEKMHSAFAAGSRAHHSRSAQPSKRHYPTGL